MKISMLLFAISLFAQSCKGEQVLNNDIDEISDSLAIVQEDDFDKVNPNWEYGYGTWQIRMDGTNKILSHTSDEAYGVALLKTNAFRDVDITVRFRPISGNTDQAGGIIFRAADNDNYYLIRANALEGNFSFYKTVDGNRQNLKSATVNKPDPKQWHNLRVIMKGNHLQAFLDNKLFLDEHDTSFESGYVGVWTKADSETDFDDLVIKGIKK